MFLISMEILNSAKYRFAFTPNIAESSDVIYSNANGLSTQNLYIDRWGYCYHSYQLHHIDYRLRNTLLIEMPSECASHLLNAAFNKTVLSNCETCYFLHRKLHFNSKTCATISIETSSHHQKLMNLCLHTVPHHRRLYGIIDDFILGWHLDENVLEQQLNNFSEFGHVGHLGRNKKTILRQKLNFIIFFDVLEDVLTNKMDRIRSGLIRMSYKRSEKYTKLANEFVILCKTP